MREVPLNDTNLINTPLLTPNQSPNKSLNVTSLVSNFNNTLKRLSLILGIIFNKKVEFEIIKAQLPFQDSNILAQILGYNANKYKFRRMLKILIPRAVIKNPSKQFSPGSVGNLTKACLELDKSHIARSEYLQGACAIREDSLAPLAPVKTCALLPSSANLSCAGHADRSEEPKVVSRENNFEKKQALDSLFNIKNRALLHPKADGFNNASLIASYDAKSLGAKNLKMLISQPSSYLPPFFYSKYNKSALSLPFGLSFTDSDVNTTVTVPRDCVGSEEQLTDPKSNFQDLNKDSQSLQPSPSSASESVGTYPILKK